MDPAKLSLSGTVPPPQSAPEVDPALSFKWATVTTVTPLRIRLDGDTDPLPVTPDSLVKPANLAVGVRVWVQSYRKRVYVLGAAGGGV